MVGGSLARWVATTASNVTYKIAQIELTSNIKQKITHYYYQPHHHNPHLQNHPHPQKNQN
jgi:hypothetical protein